MKSYCGFRLAAKLAWLLRTRSLNSAPFVFNSLFVFILDTSSILR